MSDPRLSRPEREWLEGVGVESGLAPLAGDASARQYLRGTGGDGGTVVISRGGDPERFTRWSTFYRELGLRVPRVLAWSGELQLAVMEDLGDELLQHRVERAGAAACAPLYHAAVESGLRLAREGTPRFRPHDDEDDPLTASRLAVEMDVFLQHVRPSQDADPKVASPEHDEESRTSARRWLHQLCVDVHQQAPMVLCHRDYHARNLMPVREDLAIIDFQDTRRGPRAYDLASLAHDPYVDLPASLVEELVDAWRPGGVEVEAWRREVDLAAGQRLIKAAGTYALLGHARGRRTYLRWLEPAVTRALACLRRSWPPAPHLEHALAELAVPGAS